MKSEWTRWVGLGLALLGWAYTLGITRAEIKLNTAHQDIQFHDGVRDLTEANGARIVQLEIGQARIDEKLAQILREIRAN